MTAPCPACGAPAVDPARLHDAAAALAADDLDAALELGLMELARCEACLDRCDLAPAEKALLRGARDARSTAWAARDRHRARADRLARRAVARREASAPAPGTPALPTSAADALARALARARRP